MSDRLTLLQTCGGCPEQYDVLHNGVVVGYMRLRHGHFRCECPVGETIYSTDTKADGVFDVEEREQVLIQAVFRMRIKLGLDKPPDYKLSDYVDIEYPNREEEE